MKKSDAERLVMGWINECKEKAIKIPKVKRQEFLDLLWERKTINEARNIIGVDFETGLGILEMNLVDRKELNKVSS